MSKHESIQRLLQEARCGNISLKHHNMGLIKRSFARDDHWGKPRKRRYSFLTQWGKWPKMVKAEGSTSTFWWSYLFTSQTSNPPPNPNPPKQPPSPPNPPPPSPLHRSRRPRCGSWWPFAAAWAARRRCWGFWPGRCSARRARGPRPRRSWCRSRRLGREGGKGGNGGKGGCWGAGRMVFRPPRHVMLRVWK